MKEMLDLDSNPDEENLKYWGYTFCRLIIHISAIFPIMNIIYLRISVYRYIFCGLDIDYKAY